MDLISNDDAVAKLKKNLDHNKHFLRCNSDIVENFLRSIPKPYETDQLVEMFDYFTCENNCLSIAALETFLAEHTGKPLRIGNIQLCLSISLQLLRNQLGKVNMPAHILSNMCYCLRTMLSSSWTLDQVCDLLSAVKKANTLSPMSHVLTIITDYKLTYNQSTFNFLDPVCPTRNWSHRVLNHALRVCFPRNSKELDLDESINAIINETYLTDEERVTERERLSNAFNELSLHSWHFASMDLGRLKNWLMQIRTNRLYEQIAYVIRAADLLFGRETRLVQKLAILLALGSSKTTARILQINTGEGKTRIVAILAAIKGLQGVKTDVITSSSVLAAVQAAELKNFYKFFNLKVACNKQVSPFDRIYGQRRRKGESSDVIFDELGRFQPVYACDVIYGSAHDFEADLLRDEFLNSGVRCGRQCEFALVDEADNMMIDGRHDILRLSTHVPSVFHLLPIKAIIWNNILDAAEMVMNEGDESIQDFCVRKILPMLEKSIHLDETEPDPFSRKLIIPKHLHTFTKAKLEVWVRTAVRAKFEMKEGYQYMLKNNKIVSVDAKNTGLLHANRRWSDGLHCFLEMKHGCSLEPEHINTNFISHVAFFCRYSTNLIGLTGTVGGEASKRILREVYSVDCLIIPPFRQRRHFELYPRLLANESDWLKSVVRSCEEKMRQMRAVLVIMEYIGQAERVAVDLEAIFPNQVKLYTDNDQKDVARETLEAGYALVATNIAGRGTDLLVTDEVEQNGGLHVCITFLPENDRVERQNQGRTSRSGNRGTSQMIVHWSDLPEQMFNKADYLQSRREQRNQHELSRMQSVLDDVKRVVDRDSKFQEFSARQSEIVDCFPAHVRDIAQDALREQFGFWLIESESKTNKELHQSFNEFSARCRHDPRNTLINNPIYYVRMANELLQTGEALINDVITFLDDAIGLDQYCAASAYYSRAYARALQYSNTLDIERLSQAIHDFRQARRMIQHTLESTLTLFPVTNDESPLSHYVFRLKTIYGMLMSSIDEAIGPPVDEEIEDLKMQLENSNLNGNEHAELCDYIQELENSRDHFGKGVLQRVAKNKIELHIQHQTLKDSLSRTEEKELYKREIAEIELNGFIGIVFFNHCKPADRESATNMKVTVKVKKRE